MAKLLDGTRIYGTATVDTKVLINGGLSSTSTLTGSLIVTGGVGISQNLYVGNILSVGAYTTSTIRTITGSIGQIVAISNATPSGSLAFWDVTNNRWSYVNGNGAV